MFDLTLYIIGRKPRAPIHAAVTPGRHMNRAYDSAYDKLVLRLSVWCLGFKVAGVRKDAVTPGLHMNLAYDPA